MSLIGRMWFLMTFLACTSTVPQNQIHSYSDIVVMVRPTYFEVNPETAKTNSFVTKNSSSIGIKDKAIEEYMNMVQLLRKNKISVIDLPAPHKLAPDAVFSNNWFTLHAHPKKKKNILIIYPMLNESRQLETKNLPVLIRSLKANGVDVDEIIDFTLQPALEGTGVLVGVHNDQKNLYVGQSARAHLPLAKKVAKLMGKKLVSYQTADKNNTPIYHTNVLQGETQSIHIICLEAIRKEDREKVLKGFRQTGLPIVIITLAQMENMCGNVIELTGEDNQKFLLMSQNANDHFTTQQKEVFKKAGLKIISPNISTIESVGGGSARCMVGKIEGRLRT